MKTVSLVFILLICLFLGMARYYDLSYFTGADGLVTVMNASIRYLTFLVPIILIFVHSTIFLRKRGRTISGKGFYIIMLLVGIIHIFASVFLYLYVISLGSTLTEIIIAVAMFLSGIWFTLSGFVSLTSNQLAVGPMFFALFGTAYYYILMLYRFVTIISSTDRVSSIIEVLVPMTVVIFLTSLVKHLYGLSRSAFAISISGLICFLFASSISSAEVIYGIINNTMLPVPFLQNISSFSIGLLALYTTIYYNKDKKIRVMTIY